MKQHFEIVVVGAGIQGLSTAHALLARGVSSLALIDQFELGHELGSSHGRSRITRSTYNHPKYVELMQFVHGECWPAWEEECGQKLLHPNPGLFWGPGAGPYRESLRAFPEVWSKIEELTPKQARVRFPAFRFPDVDWVLLDHSCAVLAAQRTREFLIQAIGKSQATVLQNCPVEHWQGQPDELVLSTAQGEIGCQKLIVTAGPWTSKLLPLGSKLRVAHQDVGYFVLQHPMQAGPFPVWVYAGHEAGDSFYGLPQFERDGVKLARHRTSDRSDHPDRAIAEKMPCEALADLQEFAGHQWAGPVHNVGYEACLYTNTCSEDFILDHWTDDPRVIVGAGFSGHGFKFAPLIGRILANLACPEHPAATQAFEKFRHEFSLAAAQNWSF